MADKIQFIKNLLGLGTSAEQAMVREAAQHARKTGNEMLLVGETQGPQIRPDVLRSYGDAESVRVPGGYDQFMLDAGRTGREVSTAHPHPVNIALPSMGDIETWANAGRFYDSSSNNLGIGTYLPANQLARENMWIAGNKGPNDVTLMPSMKHVGPSEDYELLRKIRELQAKNDMNLGQYGTHGYPVSSKFRDFSKPLRLEPWQSQELYGSIADVPFFNRVSGMAPIHMDPATHLVKGRPDLTAGDVFPEWMKLLEKHDLDPTKAEGGQVDDMPLAYMSQYYADGGQVEGYADGGLKKIAEYFSKRGALSRPQFPIDESISKQRLRGKDQIVQVDAESLRDALQKADPGLPLSWKQSRYDNINDILNGIRNSSTTPGYIDAYPEVGFKGERGTGAVVRNDGGHRISVAADRGMSIPVATQTPEEMFSLQRLYGLGMEDTYAEGGEVESFQSGGQKAAQAIRAALAAFDKTPKTEGYVYHATSVPRLHDIAEEGLRTHKPWEHTDQGAWPDGLVRKRAYFANSPQVASSFSPDDGPPALLRTMLRKGIERESTGDFYSHRPIKRDDLEWLDTNGAWNPLKLWSEGE